MYRLHYTKQIKRRFKDEFQCSSIFLEPHHNGSWHVHFIIGFIENIPENFENETKKWWAKYNNHPTTNQVKVQRFRSLQDLINCVNYLNPANVEKKKSRVKYYPKSAQPIRHFGEVSEPNRALTDWETAKKVVGFDEPTTRKKLEIYDIETSDLLYQRSTYHHYNICFKFKVVSPADDTKNIEKKINSPFPESPLNLEQYEQMTLLLINDRCDMRYKPYHYG